MRWFAACLLTAVFFCSHVYGSESFYDVYGTVSRIDEWPLYLNGTLQGRLTTITVNGQSYPVVARPKVFHADNPPAMYPKYPARWSDIQEGSQVNLRLNGHSVVEIILTR